eukprot:m.211467 g.211467  ORF g.211467 m.211467 type:complete len:86 (+) comp33104_c4_seq40:234-491(+)
MFKKTKNNHGDFLLTVCLWRHLLSLCSSIAHFFFFGMQRTSWCKFFNFCEFLLEKNHDFTNQTSLFLTRLYWFSCLRVRGFCACI